MNRTTVLLLLVLPFLGGCKKFIERKQEEAALEIVTNGRWKVNAFTVDGADSLTHFSGYSFQFHENNTVEAIRSNVVEETGSWQVNVSTKTITAGFVSPARALQLLNGTWLITNSTTTSVDATQNVNGGSRTLHLDKI
jgi:hypothetical protein